MADAPYLLFGVWACDASPVWGVCRAWFNISKTLEISFVGVYCLLSILAQPLTPRFATTYLPHPTDQFGGNPPSFLVKKADLTIAAFEISTV
jgi:hypothetical protein